MTHKYDSYIISLKNPKDKIKYLNKNGLNVEWMKGVRYGDKIFMKYIDYFHPQLFHITSKSAAGIAIAHIRCWEKFLKTDKEHIIIFEDDIILKKNFKEQFDNSVKKMPKDTDILYLGCFGCENNNNFFTKVYSLLNNKNSKIINKNISIPKIALATHAYIITRKGAKQILQLCYNNVFGHIDIFLQSLIKNNNLKSYVITPLLTLQTSVINGNSNNVNTNYPILLNKQLQKIKINNTMTIDYAISSSIFRIGNVDFNILLLIILLIGIILAKQKIQVHKIIFIFLIFNIYDILKLKNIKTLYIILSYLIILILPSYFL
jgi:GR25 family glycosyltransferase involved in LPS biosynthesis